MCSISGFTWQDKNLIENMNKVLSYRGPDDNGVYLDKFVSLGHNRLSILDLSKAGHQPMSNKEGTIWVVYNGEIYNYLKIREVLEKKEYKFNSNTDTEVLIYAYEEFGLKCLSLFNGMFAFAIWDNRKKELILARDRIGIKPLYYTINKNNLIFSSEIKGILQHEIDKTIDLQSLNSYLTYKFIPSHKTLLNNIFKLLPGHYAIFKDNKLTIHKYWELNWNISDKSEVYYLEQLKELLFSAVERRLISDVPLGVYLSGGVDSSLIVAINSKLRKESVNTFTVGFGEESDEFQYAKKVSEFLSTNHHEIILDYSKITRELPTIIWHMDDPNTDITMVPLYFLSKYAKQTVTVVNTGEGADELFSGYAPYTLGSTMLKPIPNIFKKYFFSWYYSPYKHNHRKSLFNFPFDEDKTLFYYLNCKKYPLFPKNFLNKQLFFDIKNELPNWQLARVDRMTMAHSMEARVPFLDHELVEFCTKLPVKYKQPNHHGKYLLKKFSLNYLPKEIVFRKKQGFTTPLHSWLRDNLEDIVFSVLFNNKKPFFNYDYIYKLLLKHKKSKKQKLFRYHSFQLLILLFLDIWYEMYVNNKTIRELENLVRI